MIIGNPKTLNTGGPGKAEKAADSPEAAGKDDNCRCKAASEMSPGELLKLMVSDLVFWKKTKSPKTENR